MAGLLGQKELSMSQDIRDAKTSLWERDLQISMGQLLQTACHTESPTARQRRTNCYQNRKGEDLGWIPSLGHCKKLNGGSPLGGHHNSMHFGLLDRLQPWEGPHLASLPVTQANNLF
jgi:hypothetical protein